MQSCQFIGSYQQDLVGNARQLAPAGIAVLDQAARLFREGNPVVMTVSGHSDRQGREYENLLLSARRAETVKQALVARGIPAARLRNHWMARIDPPVHNERLSGANDDRSCAAALPIRRGLFA